MQEVKIKATVDPKEAQVGFHKVEQAATTMAGKVSRSATAMRNSLNSVSGSAMGIAKVFITMEVAKRALRGLYEMAQLTSENKKNIDAMNAAMSGTAVVISEKMTPAVTAIAGLIKETADEWTAFLSGGNFGGTTDKQFEKLRDMQMEILKLQEQTTKGNRMQMEGAKIALEAKKKEYDAAVSLYAEQTKFNAEEAQRIKQAADDEERAAQAVARQLELAKKVKELNAAREQETNSGILLAQADRAEEVRRRNLEQQKKTDEEIVASVENRDQKLLDLLAEAQKAKQDQEQAELDSFVRTQRLEKTKLQMREQSTKQQLEMFGNVSQAAANGFATMQIMFGKEKKLAIAQAIAQGGVAVANALAIQPWWLGLSQAALATAMTAQNVNQISSAKAFAKGGDFVTNGPEMIMVGDNSGGRERVQVTPLSSPNINGPKGGGSGLVINATIYNTGSAARDEAYTDRALRQIAEQVRQAVRQGYNLGLT